MSSGNQGWSTKGKEGRKGAGRPVTTGTRPAHMVRAWTDEWELIKMFMQIVRNDKEKAIRMLQDAKFS